MEKQRYYVCIDLKSFYASCECVARGLDPFKTNLVVADPSRPDTTICLAVSPSLKKLGVPGRCRIYEIPKTLDYVVAKPRMKYYMDISAQIYSVYLRYIAKEDIHVYSIDECFIDVTDYINLYSETPVGIAKMLISAVFEETGIRAAAGIGTNLFLCKVALDITAKHADDFIGVLDEEEFKKTIWYHRPITDIWNIGKGIAKRLEKYGIFDLHGISVFDQKILYKEFGINAEFLIDHANGKEPCLMKDIHEYKTKSTSLSTSQILPCGYTLEEGLIVMTEMCEQLILELVGKGYVTDCLSLYVSYDKREEKSTGGSFKIPDRTNSRSKILAFMKDFYIKTTDSELLVRKITIGFNNLLDESYSTRSFFIDFDKEEKEHELVGTVINIKRKYGRNSILMGNNYTKKATQRERNKMVGGHRSGEDDEN